MKILKLTLKKKWFDIMVTGEKNYEVRKPSKWIMSRLSNKSYELVEFKNGYRKDSPKFLAEYKGFIVAGVEQETTFRNGLKLKISADDIIIKLGKVIND